jgi:hypothetical protein
MLVVVAIGLTACSHAPSRELGPVGTRVTVRGTISDKPWAHMMTNVPGKQSEYFDLDAKHQTVIYWAAPITCPGEIEITGTVIEASGPGKRRGDSEPPYTFTERSVDVDTARCVD